ncbi:hypothetical protein MNB_SV-9-1194 [hydrothermal vent metagenome]|uniref:Rhodanese domain-containing protein n=1 Tax=hydrothermal vent metagenome TaxID=652676 RepID=A0A1W1C807_9ZZZZ
MEELLFGNNINSKELKELLEQRKNGEVDFVLVDVREDIEYKQAHIKGIDILRPSTKLQLWGPALVEEFKDKTLILTCRTGARSGHIQRILKKNGHNSVINHSGGIMSYNGITERG